jgi:hypothetical protein
MPGFSSEPGLASRLEILCSGLGSVVAALDPDRLCGGDAASLYSSFAALERLSVAGKTLLAPRIETSGVFRQGGHRDAASLLASLEGVSTGAARHTLSNGRRLGELPSTEEALRQGTLSAPKLTQLTGAGVLDPARETELLQGAEDQPLAVVTERCQRSRATSASQDPVATVRRIHAARHFSSWTDAEGAFCYQGRETADRGARILSHLGHAARSLRKARTRHDGTGADGEPTPERAMRADALFALITQQGIDHPDPDPQGSDPQASAHRGSDHRGPPGSPAAPPTAGGHSTPGPRSSRGSPGPTAPSPGLFDPSPWPDRDTAGNHHPDDASADSWSIIARPPTCTTVVRVDLDALLRGHAERGEVCEIDGQGPIPVTMARDLANDSALRVLFHQAGDIKAISHLGRTINAKLRTGLVSRDRTCVVPGCRVDVGLEIDHVQAFHLGGPTELDNLALLCHHHHRLKTYDHWILQCLGTDSTGEPVWSFEPQPPFGQEPELGIDTPESRARWRQGND